MSQRGTTLGRIKDQAEQLGFNSRAVRVELEELPQLRTPTILHWDLDHFVVLKSVKRNALVIVDPAVGTRRITLAEANKRFTGVALELGPTPEFTTKKGERPCACHLSLPSCEGFAHPSVQYSSLQSCCRHSLS